MEQSRWIYWSIAFMMLALLVTPGQTEPRYDVHGDIVRPGAEEFTGVFVDTRNLSADGTGLVLIDDSIYTIDPKAVFRTQSGGLTSLPNFKEGTPVKFFAVDSLLTKMWAVGVPVTREEPGEAAGAVEDGKPASGLRLEDGVWKN